MSAKNAVDELKSGLKASKANEREEAIGAFCRRLMIEGEVDVPQPAIELVINCLEEDKSSAVRMAAADFLAWTAEWTHTEMSDEQLKRCCSMLEDKAREKCHPLLARSMGYIPTDNVRKMRVKVLRSTLRNSKDEEAKIQAIEALGRLKATNARQDLLDALEDKSEAIRHTSVLAFGLMGERRGIEAQLINHLGIEKSQEVRAATINSLCLMGSRKVRAALVKIVEATKEDDMVRVEALKAVPVLYHEKFQDCLLTSLVDESERLRGVGCLLMIEQRMDLEEDGFEEKLKAAATAMEGKPEQALLLWSLHKWRCAIAGRGSMPEYNRRLDDFLVEYAEQSLLNDPTVLTSRGYSKDKKKGPA